MNSALKSLIACSFALLTSITTQAVVPTYKIRSQSRNKVIQIVGSTNHTYLYGKDSWWGTFSIAPEYMQSFRTSRIGASLFGNSIVNTIPNACCSSYAQIPCDSCAIAVQGSAVDNRNPRAWLADYFYLPVDFESTLIFEPRIRTFNLNFDAYIGLDQWAEGLYFSAYGPFTHTRWDLDFCETITNAGTADNGAGYFTPQTMPSATLLHAFADYAAGDAPAPLTQFANTITPADPITTSFYGLRYARMSKCVQTENGFADLRAELGWNFCLDEDYHAGVNIQAAAPTGNKIKAKKLFAPQVGNGKHWELGAGITAHYVFWRSENEEKHFGFYADLNLTHLFKRAEQRTFDLKNKPMSRYMLAAQVGANNEGLRGTSTTGMLASNQFAAIYNPLANLTTFDVEVTVGIQTDLVVMFNFTAGRFSWDIGYNFWSTSCEDIDCNDMHVCATRCKKSPTLCDTTEQNTWILKGDTQLYGYQTDSGSAFFNTAIPLSASNSLACITRGTANSDDEGVKAADTNAAADHAQGAFTSDSPTQLQTSLGSGRTISTSIQPTFLDCHCVDFKALHGLSNKVFTHFAYTWERENLIPYIGVGASAEFGKNEKTHGNTNFGCGSGCDSAPEDECSSECDDDSCTDCALSQWGIWLKAGISYN